MTLCGHGMLLPNHGAVRSLAAKFVMNFSAQPLQRNPGIVLGACPYSQEGNRLIWCAIWWSTDAWGHTTTSYMMYTAKQCKYQVSWTNQMSLGIIGYKRCLFHTPGWQTSWLSTECIQMVETTKSWIMQFHLTRWNFACPYHPSDNINILDDIEQKHYWYIIIITMTMTMVSRTFIIHIVI